MDAGKVFWFIRKVNISLYVKEMMFQHIFYLFYFFTSFSFLAAPCGTWDLSVSTRGRTRAPCSGSQSLNHWTAREVPGHYSLKMQVTEWF